MNRTLQDRALRLLRHGEGVRRYAYDDATGKRVRAPKGILTVGAGINLDTGLDEYEIDLLERHRLHVGMEVFKRELSTTYGIVFGLLKGDVQVALSLMVFQLGPDGVLEFDKMLRAIKRGDLEEAAAQAWDSKWARETPRRVVTVADLFKGSV